MADKYHVFEMDGVSQAQSAQLTEDLGTVDVSGVTISGLSWSPDDNVFKMDLGGPDLTAPLAAIRAQIQTTLGKSPEVDLEVARDTSQCRTGLDCQAGNRTQLKPIDRVLFNAASGDLTSRKGLTYAANGTILYNQAGPRAELKACQLNSGDAGFSCNAPSWMIPGTKDFAIEFWIKHLSTNPNNQQVLFDYGFVDGTTAGIAVWLTPTSCKFGIHDGTNRHISSFEHDGHYWQDGLWHRFGWVAVRNRNKAHLFVGDDLFPTVKDSGVDLDQIGNVDPAGPIVLGHPASAGASPNVFGGCFAGVQLSVL